MAYSETDTLPGAVFCTRRGRRRGRVNLKVIQDGKVCHGLRQLERAATVGGSLIAGAQMATKQTFLRKTAGSATLKGKKMAAFRVAGEKCLRL